MRRPVTIHGIERARAEITLHVAEGDPAAPWLSTLHVGDRVALLGPLGKPIRLDRRSHHVLFVADAASVALLLPLADEALATGRQVTLLVGARSGTDVYPSSLLPDEVEYVVATDDGSLGHSGSVVDLVIDYEAWADQAVAAGPAWMLDRLVGFAAGRDRRLGVARLGRRTGRRATAAATRSAGPAWLQVFLPQTVGCALGICLGCVVPGIRDGVRVCRDGPVFAAEELAWDEPS
jgi:dihydroorotate dehydrogenase electron transfer subunit